jgi:hypothetical protein
MCPVPSPPTILEPPARAALSRLAAAGPVALLLGAAMLLAILQLMPRPGGPVGLLFPDARQAEEGLLRVLAEGTWAPLTVRRLGPVTLLVAVPLPSGGQPGLPSGMAGAWLAVAADGIAGCTPGPTRL